VLKSLLSEILNKSLDGFNYVLQQGTLISNWLGNRLLSIKQKLYINSVWES
jgi:hypothetical protein